MGRELGLRSSGAVEAVVESQLAREPGDVTMLVGCEEGDPDALSACPAGAADPVDVGLAVPGRVEVDHVRDPVYVKPAGRDVGRHEDVDRAGLKAGERLLALAL